MFDNLRLGLLMTRKSDTDLTALVKTSFKIAVRACFATELDKQNESGLYKYLILAGCTRNDKNIKNVKVLKIV
jgi:hypothetical protein